MLRTRVGGADNERKGGEGFEDKREKALEGFTSGEGVVIWRWEGGVGGDGDGRF